MIKHILSIMLIGCTTMLSGQDLTKGALKVALEGGSFIVEEIAAHNILEGPTVGFAGSRSDQYLRFQKWLNSSSEDELIKMTDHDNGVIRAYAFWGLVEKKSAHIKEIAEGHSDDHEQIQTLFGCIMQDMSVREFMQKVLRGEI